MTSKKDTGRPLDRPKESVCLELEILRALRRHTPENREKALRLLPPNRADQERSGHDAPPRPR